MFTLALSVSAAPGANRVCTRLKSERQGSVANSSKAILSALARSAIGAALEVAVAVADGPPRDGEAMQHREPVEPVAHALLADLEPGRAGAQQRPLQPHGDLAAQLELIEDGLLRGWRSPACGRWSCERRRPYRSS